MRIMTLRVCLLSLALSLAACGGEGDPDLICQEGQTRCQGDLLERCQNNAWLTDTDCGSLGQSCGADPTSGEPACLADTPNCTEDSLRCTGDSLERCVHDAWQTDTDCGSRGQSCGTDPTSGDPACLVDTPNCTENSLRCTGDLLERCVHDAWQTDTDCGSLGQSCGADPTSGDPACLAGTPNCTEDSLRCTGDLLERCVEDAWQTESDCLAFGELCRVDEASGLAACEALSWNRILIEIDDPIVNGSSLMMPVDGISYAHDQANDVFATSFGSAYDDPTVLFLWLFDGASGRHFKQFLSGEPMAASTPFCVGGEDWCQYIGFDPVSSDWTVLGPSSPTMMRIDENGLASQQATSGNRPPDSWINRTFRHDWISRKLWEYGAVGPSGFGHTLYAFDMDSGVWSEAKTRLPQVMDNCLVVDAVTGLHYSFGGKTTDDGGDTSTLLDSYVIIDPQSDSFEEQLLPVAMGARRSMSCALDADRGLVFLLGGSVVRDNWNEIENDYHNDLWAYRLSDGVFFQILEDTPGGIFLEPDSYGDRSFEGDPEGPNFGMNVAKMTYDPAADRLLVIGEVPIFTHEQVYWMELEGIEALLEQ